jgi:lysophospholipase L1-like esterase
MPGLGQLFEHLLHIDRIIGNYTDTMISTVNSSRPATKSIQPTPSENTSSLGERAGGAIELTLPKTIFAAPETEMSMYFNNIVLSQEPENFRFSIECHCQFGRTERRRWVAAPSTKDVGDYRVAVSVSDWNNNKIATGETVLRVPSRKNGEGERYTLLIVGDSLTHQNVYPLKLAQLLSQPGNAEWRMIGTNHASGKTPPIADSTPGIFHEGYGGWTWHRFLTHYQPETAKLYYRGQSPFVFKNPDGAIKLNVARFFRESTHGVIPDVVIFQLGINDTWSANPDDPPTLDHVITAVFKDADKLLSAFRSAAPRTKLALCLPQPFTANVRTFYHTYGDQFPMWRQKRIQHRLVQRMIEHYSGKEREGIYLIPTNMSLDPIDGYPIDNAGHPNEYGNQQVATTIYSWLKWWSAQR